MPATRRGRPGTRTTWSSRSIRRRCCRGWPPSPACAEERSRRSPTDRGAVRRQSAAASFPEGRMKNNPKLNALVDDVEELLAELEDEHGPEVQELRGQVEEALVAVRRAIHKHDSTVARIGRY